MDYEHIDFNIHHPEPLLIVISGPSGVGKDSVVKALKMSHTPFHFVVTATSRAPRVGEVNGVDYFFITKEEFERMAAEDELLEHSLVYDQHKGIPKQQVREALASGLDTVMRIDVQGAAKVRAICPEAVLVFMVPSSAKELYERLAERETETVESLKLRMDSAIQEMKCVDQFDYVVVNETYRLEECAATILAIIRAEHHRNPHRKITL